MKKSFLLLSALALSACGGAAQMAADHTAQALDSITPKKNFYMRSNLDNDAESYLGRFVANNVSEANLDEVSAEKNKCSKFFKFKKVAGSGIKYDEYYKASMQASAGLQIPVKQFQAGLNQKSQTIARVQYQQGDKWTAEVEDLDGFSACCAEVGCPDRYIAEFVGGTGSISYISSLANDDGFAVEKVGGASYKDGFEWKKSLDFPKQVFFAFRLGSTPGAQTMNSASQILGDDWCENLPSRSDGKYFCGVSRWMDEESVARDQALFDARVQVIRYIGEELKLNSKVVKMVDGKSSNQTESSEVERAASGLASYVKAEKFKVEEDQQPGQRLYRVKALAFIKNSDLKAAGQKL